MATKKSARKADDKKMGEKSSDEKKSDDTKTQVNEETSSNKMLIVLGVVVIAIIAIGLLLMMAPQEDDSVSDAEILASAISEAGQAMQVAESANPISIIKSDAVIDRNGTHYLASFAVTGSEEITSFDVVIDTEMSLSAVGFNAQVMSPDKFIKSQQGVSPLQKCAQIFNEQYVVPKLIMPWYNGTTHTRYIWGMPKMLNCSGEEYPYTLELGDGYAKTTIAGNYFTNGFTKGIIVDNTTIPSEDSSKGIYLYIDRVAPYKLAYSYELIEDSYANFDAPAGDLANDYSLMAVPSIVWNCQYVNVGTKATGELNGTEERGTEELVLKTFTCLYNNGVPEEVCAPLGVIPDENGKINLQLPPQYILTTYSTGLDNCRPDNDTVKAEVFYKVDCPDCQNQRQVMEIIEKRFGDYIDVTYYCVGAECEPLFE